MSKMGSYDNHGDMVLAGLKELYDSGELTDVTLQSLDTQLSCHRNILAACSPYFRAMFTIELRESGERTIELHDIGPDVLSAIVDYIYTGHVSITNSNIQSLLLAGNMLQLERLSKLCMEYAIQELDADNCIDVYNMADFVELNNLKESTKSFIFSNFDRISETDVVCSASLDLMIEMLSNDDLITENEETVFKVLEKWILFEPSERKTYFPLLFQYIRIPLLDKSFICNDLVSNELVLHYPDIRERLNIETLPKGKDPDHYASKLRKGMFNRQLLIFSGGSTSEDTRSFTCYDPETKKSYTGVEQHPTFDAKFKIEHFQLIVGEGNSIFFIGGAWKQTIPFEDTEAVKDVYTYSQRDRKWVDCSPMTHGRCSFAACVYENRIYVFGGKNAHPNGQSKDEAEFYIPDSDKWQLIQPMPVGISHHAVTVWKNSIFLFGGIDDDKAYLNTVLSYSIFRDTWSLVPTELYRPRADCQAFTFKEAIFVLGGADKHEYRTNVEIYDPEKNRWTEGQSFPEMRKCVSMTALKNFIYVCGGFKQLGTRQGYHRRTRTVETKDLYRYDVINDLWSFETKMIPVASNTCCSTALVNINYLTESTSEALI